MGCISMMLETLQKTFDGMLRTIAKEDFAAAFRSRKERCEKCTKISFGHVKKYSETKVFSSN
jgi:predicted double-glycine peptidase